MRAVTASASNGGMAFRKTLLGVGDDQRSDRFHECILCTRELRRHGRTLRSGLRDAVRSHTVMGKDGRVAVEGPDPVVADRLAVSS